MSVKIQSGGHWYLPDGTPQHDLDLRGARKVGAYPSPTSIDKTAFPNPGLDIYKTNQLLEAAGNNSRMPHESIEQYQQRIYDLSKEHSEHAAEFGKELHAMLDAYPAAPADARLLAYFTFFDQWYQENIVETIASEAVEVDHDIGVAGRGDRKVLHKRLGRAYLDYKSQDVKKNDKGVKQPAFYDSWGRQLSFYGACDAKTQGYYPKLPVCISLIFDSNEATPPYVKEWTQEEIVSHYIDFTVGAWRWFRSKRNKTFPMGYWPGKNGPFDIRTTLQMPE